MLLHGSVGFVVGNIILSQRSDRQHRKPKRHESCEAEWCSQEHIAQRKVEAVEEQQKLVKKSWEDQAEALTEIQVEEKQVAEIKNSVQTVKSKIESGLPGRHFTSTGRN